MNPKEAGAAHGRLWAAWCAGGPDERGKSAGNQVMLGTSAGDGKSWSGPRPVIDPPGDVRAFDPTSWHPPVTAAQEKMLALPGNRQ
jgi:hypothetical protein